MLPLDLSAPSSLVLQIALGIKALIDERKLSPGARLPSIRQFAESHGVSVSTVVEAYDRLVADGYLIARQSSGFYVRAAAQGIYREEAQSLRNVRFDPLWFVRRAWENRSAEVTPGFGWVPDAWLDNDAMRRALRALSGKPPGQMLGYGNPRGLTSLRLKISAWLGEQEIAAAPDQVLLTAGASHGIELVSHYLLRPGDTVLVDEPGYSVMISNLRARGARMVGAPWTPQGPDVAALDELASRCRPRAFFTNSRLHNPTGASCSSATAHRVLQIADRHDFIVVEDDVCADLDVGAHRSLACMDQLRRVIYLNSFSKSVSPRLRVGFIAAHRDAIEDITQIKMMTGLTSSEIAERMAHEILSEGRFRKHIRALRERLGEAQKNTAARLQEVGLELFDAPEVGLFLWARHPLFADSAALCNEAIKSDLLLAPGHLFMTQGQASPWMRFNAGFSNSPRLYDFLGSLRCRIPDDSIPAND
ncbi:MAG: PLP-dependent aminotransferase family protein [Zoogloeaceae bacterium]|jgi:DNA-binding transcriptional MocR family regulator|nr:PLP-dependent aminotransferase family protein [Zoogloeaceae bacterium]